MVLFLIDRKPSGENSNKKMIRWILLDKLDNYLTELDK